MREFGYINDERYAFNYIMYRIHDKSRQKIFQELQQKGVDRQTIQSAWDEAEELEAADEHALLLARSRRNIRRIQKLMNGRCAVFWDTLQGEDSGRVRSPLHWKNCTLHYVQNIQTNG